MYFLTTIHNSCQKNKFININMLKISPLIFIEITAATDNHSGNDCRQQKGPGLTSTKMIGAIATGTKDA
jgi:hypothetical protein